MKPLIPILSTILSGCVALADTTPYRSICGIQFDPRIDQTKQAHICQLSQLPQFKGTLAKVKHLPSDQIQNGFYLAMGTNNHKELYIYPASDRLNPKQLSETLLHEFGHLLWYKLNRENNPLLEEYNQAWQSEGTMLRQSDIVDPKHVQSTSMEGFAEAVKFVILKDPLADRYPKQKAVIQKILALNY